MEENECMFPSMQHSVADMQTKHRRTKYFRTNDRVIYEVAMAIAHGRAGHQIRGLPADVEMIGVYYEHTMKAMTFIACSMEWPVHVGAEKMEEAAVEVVHAPTEADQMVLWKQLTSDLSAKQRALTVAEAEKLVTSKGWKDGTAKIDDE